MARVGLESWSSTLTTSSRVSTKTKPHFADEHASERQPFAKTSTLKTVGEEGEPQDALTPLKGGTVGKIYVIAFITITFIGACLFSCAAPFFPTKAISKGVSQTMVGVIMGSSQIVGFIVSGILAMTMFKIGIKFLLCAGMLVAGVCAVLFGIIDFGPPGDSFMILSFAIRVFEGAGIAMYFNSAYTLAAILFADNYATLMGFLETSTSVGTLLGPTIGGALYALGGDIGYFIPFTVLGGILIVLLPFAIWLVPSSIADGVDVTRDEHNPLHVFSKMFNATMLTTAYTMLAATTSWIFTETTLGVRLEKFNVTNPLTVGAIYLASSGAYAIAAPLSGRIADRFKNGWLCILVGTIMLVVGYLILGPCPILFASFIPEGLPQLIIGCLCTHSGLASVVVPTTAEFQRQAELNGLDPNSMGTLAFITSVFQSMWFMGGFIGSIISSALMENLGYGWATTVQAGIVSTSLVLQIVVLIWNCSCKAKQKGYGSFENEESESLVRKE